MMMMLIVEKLKLTPREFQRLLYKIDFLISL